VPVDPEGQVRVDAGVVRRVEGAVVPLDLDDVERRFPGKGFGGVGYGGRHRGRGSLLERRARGERRPHLRASPAKGGAKGGQEDGNTHGIVIAFGLMARRASLPSLPPMAGPPSVPQGGPASAPRLSPPHGGGSGSFGLGSLGVRFGESPASTGDLRSGGAPLAEGIAMTAVTQLLDRLSATDDAPFAVSWIESVTVGRARIEPPLAVRLLRAYREVGRIDRARELSAALPGSPSGWNPLDAARLSIERAILAMIDGRPDLGDTEVQRASRLLGQSPRGSGLSEQLDLYLTSAQLEIRQNRIEPATAALRLAEHLAERLEDRARHVPVAMTLGHLSMRIADPRTAVKHYGSALGRSPTRGITATWAHGHLAVALGSIGKSDEARGHAERAIEIAGELHAGWRHADAYDVLAIVEIAADRPLAALHAIDEAQVVLGEIEQPTLRYQLAEHRTLALAMLGRAQAARQWLSRAEKCRPQLIAVDTVDAQDLLATRARVAEAAGQWKEAMELALTGATELAGAFVTGSLNLVLARCALAVGDVGTARLAVERAALSGDEHGWIFPERAKSAAAWELAGRSGDSRVVRYAERILASTSLATSLLPDAPWSDRVSALAVTGSGPESEPESLPAVASPAAPPSDGEMLIYVTTAEGVARVRKVDLERATVGAALVVDTLSHALRVQDRAVSLERRRALEPLVVQLLRRAREGLLGEEVLRAAGGPGPDSADAEHRVRVLISRVRDLLGDPSAIERVRDAGEYGKTRYRLAPGIRFALIEPLYAPDPK
jgi:tetratricopeptide (TPR) repeat protein